MDQNSIPEKLLKPYNPNEEESRIYEIWEKSGYFNPDKCVEDGLARKDDPFTIVLPPPNVTGSLHMGHAMMLTVQDILIRYKRMQGFRTLWLPGTDHAAIATQSKVEKEISKNEGKSRYDLGREELLKRIEIFANESHDIIKGQMKVMGTSCDWSREAYTFDEKRSFAVRTVFKKMYDEGLIYRGHRIVNWDPKGQTTISDDEIVYKEEQTKFYYLKYGPFTIGTARPETKFGDKYVVMSPNDSRYKEYDHGQKIEVEWINGVITATVIKDESIDMEFGTGVMTITPWHSQVDFEIAERHGLDKEQIIDERGKLLPIANEFAGMKITDARAKIIEKLKEKELLVKEEDYTHNIATAERTGGVIEPQIKLQWFIAVNKPVPDRDGKTLKELMRAPIAEKQINVIPEYFDKTYFHWIGNLRDWCISRQIWYGHRVPVWYKDGEIFCDTKDPIGEGWAQDEDTLDTWFSSAMWTFSTLGWPFVNAEDRPEQQDDFRIYHPTDVLETGYDILFFWVARMILMTEYTLGTVPFKNIYLHGMVRDSKGQKMSKSLGNNMDPLDIAKKYGADAGRMALVVGTAPGTDSKISEDKIKGYKLFANKIWNITRFVLSNTSDFSSDSEFTDEDRKEYDSWKEVLSNITTQIDSYNLHIAGESIYHYIWDHFASTVIEDSKALLANSNEKIKKSRQKLLSQILQESLITLHPFMPFVTETIWETLPEKIKGGNKKILMISTWPIK